MRKRHVWNRLYFGHSDYAKIRLPLIESIQGIMIRWIDSTSGKPIFGYSRLRKSSLFLARYDPGARNSRFKRKEQCKLDSVISVGRIHVNYRVALFVRVPGRIDSVRGPVNRRTNGGESCTSDSIRLQKLPMH